METGTSWRLRRRSFLKSAVALAGLRLTASQAQGRPGPRTFYFVPNMHDSTMGWLSPYHVERNFALNTYLQHQYAALRDPNYKYIFSEITNLISMMELEPARFKELRELIAHGRVELANAFVVEPTINLSGGEALVMAGVEGLRWYAQVMNASPRYAYMIDVVGWHEQMAQIVSGLELDAFIYCRYNPTDDVPEDRFILTGGDALHWMESPDGTRTLGFNPSYYIGPMEKLLLTKTALPPETVREEIQKLLDNQKTRWRRFPENAPLMTLAGWGDYSYPFAYKGYPAEMLKIWQDSHPAVELKIATLKEWFEAAKPHIDAGEYDLQVVKTGSKIYGWTAFWVNAPRAKQWFRRAEHALQSSEALSTVASLQGKTVYPTQDFSNAWFLLALNMTRDTLWGGVISEVFEHPKVWDIRDRYELVDAITSRASAKALPALWGQNSTATHGCEGPGCDPVSPNTVSLFNPCNWEREGPFELALPTGKTVEGVPAQRLEDGKTTLLNLRLPSLGAKSFRLTEAPTPRGQWSQTSGIAAPALGSGDGAEVQSEKLPGTIETAFYSAQVDPETGALVSLKLKPSGREVLGEGRANVVSAEIIDLDRYTVNGYLFLPCYVIPIRAQRRKVVSSSDQKPVLRVHTGPLATIVEMTSPFRGGELRRVMRFYQNSPRIDFVVETNDLPDGTIVTAEFPLGGQVLKLRRGIPYGFAQSEWSQLPPEQRGNNNGILPVIRWSHYTLEDGLGVGLLDRGVPGRELVDHTAIILLHNTVDYFGPDTMTGWMSGQGKQRYEYALIAHQTPWEQARIPQYAWEFNAPPLMAAGVALVDGKSSVETSQNVIVEALRRTEDEIEIRLVECTGGGGKAMVKVNLPHQGAALTNLLGHTPIPLQSANSARTQGAEYHFDIRPQQIVTLRLKTRNAVAPVEALTTFAPLIPEHKRHYTLSYHHPELVGCPKFKRIPTPVWKAIE